MADSLHRERRALAVAVRELRARKALKQEEVGEAAGLGRNYLTTLESGRTNPSFDALVRLARGLGVPLSELILLYEERLRD
ncbi:helix-turn-helix transcriptional regulator [Conexibacter stalactiti]|uniref:Helix-turn-helix transcriptional regulator n=1 Tax=Conexibacter stalactiti TaxID=1940611 RepID=A0ABU4HPD1_9ACTN|nr:helix-turn-helix transcriptional regulator [Conexibacter stalactiti]MDW5595173.1 helix-turn-helix transcriptional regulator [Conexibacter stalactiti]MEC5035815.1 helix-turn-helix transcriptional regulator [Conexibacter stalactiti]